MLLVSSSTTWFTECSGTSFTHYWVLFFGFQALDNCRAPDRRVEFANQGGAVVDQDALFNRQQADPVSGQSPANLPFSAAGLDLAAVSHPEAVAEELALESTPGSRLILRWTRVRLGPGAQHRLD